MNPTQALTIYHVHRSEQTPVRDSDLVNLATAFPTLEPVLMELQFRRDETTRLEDAVDYLRARVAALER
jgi:hypothetical protein